jgi:hypothetical protein
MDAFRKIVYLRGGWKEGGIQRSISSCGKKTGPHSPSRPSTKINEIIIERIMELVRSKGVRYECCSRVEVGSVWYSGC